LNNPDLEKAIGSVRGEYLSYRGRPIAAFYHHNCGGMTSAVQNVWPVAARPYLRAVAESPTSICRSTKSQWRFSADRRSLASCFRRQGWVHKQIALDTLSVIQRDNSGRAQSIAIESQRTLIVPVGRNGEGFLFDGRGWGHGVGLCQEGAMQMARQGKTYKQILAHYFPKTKLSHRPR
jgi:stage II sporulation protein D